MGQSKKTDNHNMPAKLELRRHFLRKYHTIPLRVFDCCQATGKIWAALRGEFQIERYWGVDLKAKKGRLKLDSVRVLDQPGWSEDVVDIDTYGSPWKHWLALLRQCRHPVTVFLTIGMVKVGGGNYDLELLPILGLDLKRLELPNSLGARLTDMALRHALLSPSSHGLRAVEIQEAESDGNARYVGIRLERAK